MLDRLQVTSKGSISVTAIATDHRDRTIIDAYVRSLGVRHIRILLDSDEKVTGPNAPQSAQLRAYGMPATYLVTPSGWIAGYITGMTDWMSPDAQRLLSYYASA